MSANNFPAAHTHTRVRQYFAGPVLQGVAHAVRAARGDGKARGGTQELHAGAIASTVEVLPLRGAISRTSGFVLRPRLGAAAARPSPPHRCRAPAPLPLALTRSREWPVTHSSEKSPPHASPPPCLHPGCIALRRDHLHRTHARAGPANSSACALLGVSAPVDRAAHFAQRQHCHARHLGV